MNTSESTVQLNAAFAAAQGEMPNAVFNRVNPHFKTQYADLASMRDAYRDALSKHGLSIHHAKRKIDDAWILFSRLYHKSGEWIETEYPIKGTTPQAFQSDLTYGKRSNIGDLTGIASEEDDDANAAELAARLKQTAAPAAKQKKTAHAARQDGTDKLYQQLTDGLRMQESLADLHMFWQSHQKEIGTMPDEWLSFLQQEKDRLKEQFKDQIDDEIPEEGGGDEGEDR